jgi:hypothetical protein
VKNKETEDEAVLRRFMQEFFPFAPLLKAGFFTKEMRYDYKAQAERVCRFFGYKTVYQYGAKETRCHITYAEGHRPNDEPFVTVIPSIYA